MSNRIEGNVKMDVGVNSSNSDNNEFSKYISKYSKVEVRAWNAGASTQIIDVSKAFNKTAAQMVGSLADGVLEFTQTISELANSKEKRNQLLEEVKDDMRQSYNNIAEYVDETADNPTKPLYDGWNYIVESAQAVKEAATGFADDFNNARELDSVGEFMGEKAAKSMANAAILAAGIAPVAKATSFFKGDKVPDFTPEASKKSEIKNKTNIDPLSIGKNKELLSELNKLNAINIISEQMGEQKGLAFFGVARSREELFEKANLMSGNMSALLIDPRVDRAGLINYLTRMGDRLSNNQEFAIVKFKYKDAQGKKSYSPSIIVTSGEESKVRVNQLTNISKKIDSELLLVWHNHPNSNTKFSLQDLVYLNKNNINSSLLSSVRTIDGIPSVITVRNSRVNENLGKNSIAPIFSPTDRDAIDEYHFAVYDHLLKNYFKK